MNLGTRKHLKSGSLGLAWIICGALVLSACGRSTPSSGPGASSPTQVASNSPSSSGGAGTSDPHGTESSIGGGNAVVCFEDPTIPAQIRAAGGELEDRFLPQIKSIEMLDLVQARESREWGLPGVPDLVECSEGETPEQYVQKIIQRWEPALPGAARILKDGVDALFRANHAIRSLHGVMKVDDANSVERVPDGCVLATMAVQYDVGIPSEGPSMLSTSEVTIDWRLYDHPKHGKLSKAVLQMHEAMYLVARKFGRQHDSRGVRTLVSYLIRKDPGILLEELAERFSHVFPDGQPVVFSPRPHLPPRTTFWPFETGAERALATIIDAYISRMDFEITAGYLKSHPINAGLQSRAKALLDRAGLHCLGKGTAPAACYNVLKHLKRNVREKIGTEEIRALLNEMTLDLAARDRDLVVLFEPEWDADWHGLNVPVLLDRVKEMVDPAEFDRWKTIFSRIGPYNIAKTLDLSEFSEDWHSSLYVGEESEAWQALTRDLVKSIAPHSHMPR